MIRRLFAALALLVLAAPLASAQSCRPDVIRFRIRGHEVAHFRVEIAATREQRRVGLMNRRHMAQDAGMIFQWEQPIHARFWMKDTLIPLDMIFLNDAGVVQRVAANAKPMDETVIDGGWQIQYVVEVNAGRAKAVGIGPGAQMQSALIPAARAAWPCAAR